MTKPTQKSSSNIKLSLPMVVAIAAFLMAAVALAAIWRVYEDVSLWSQSSLQNEIQNSKHQARFDFCFNNNIRPCDDVSIKEFNTRPENIQTDNTFNL